MPRRPRRRIVELLGENNGRPCGDCVLRPDGWACRYAYRTAFDREGLTRTEGEAWLREHADATRIVRCPELPSDR